MEFNQKLQELRKQKGLTQEELAAQLFVSRTAISKWESGRGYPSIDSLKAIAGFFSVSIDELLSGDEALTIAEADSKQKETHLRDLVFGLLDCSMALLTFLPLFGQKAEGVIQEVSLLTLSGLQPWLKASYTAIVLGTTLLGILTLALQHTAAVWWVRHKSRLSFFGSAAAVFLFILSRQPYAGAFTFIFLTIKALMLMKKS